MTILEKCIFLDLVIKFMKNLKCNAIHVLENNQNKIELVAKFSNGTSYCDVSLWIKDFIEDSPKELAKSLQFWVDHLNSIE